MESEHTLLRALFVLSPFVWTVGAVEVYRELQRPLRFLPYERPFPWWLDRRLVALLWPIYWGALFIAGFIDEFTSD